MKKTTTVPNQKIVFLNRRNTKGMHYVNFAIEDTYDVIDNMCAGEIKVYFYLCSQIPDTYDGKKNPDCKRQAPFALSTQAIKDVYPSMDKKTIQTAINKLIEKGFLTEIHSGLYQFDDLPLQYRVKTEQEYEEIQQITAEEGYKLLHKQQIGEAAQKVIKTNNPQQLQDKELGIFAWMTEEEKAAIRAKNNT